MFEAYITNTALYPLMGIEVGTTVHFPMTTQELQAALAKIGIDGKRYSEVFFTSFDSDVLGLYDYLYECENIDELNELGHALLEVRDKGGLEASGHIGPRFSVPRDCTGASRIAGTPTERLTIKSQAPKQNFREKF